MTLETIPASEALRSTVSTRKVQDVFAELCDVDIMADQVSRAMRELDEELENWRNRPMGEVKVLFADATYHKVRVNGVVVSTATFIVTGVLADGHRAILAVDSDLGENEVHCPGRSTSPEAEGAS